MSTDYSRENQEWVFYRVAHGILVENGAVLLAGNRWYKDEDLLWTAPGGRPEPGEGMHEALAREFREETGLDVSVGRLAFAVEARTSERKYHFLTLAFTVTRIGGELSCAGDDKVEELRFVPLDQLADYLPHPSLGAALRHYLAKPTDPPRYWYFPEYTDELKRET